MPRETGNQLPSMAGRIRRLLAEDHGANPSPQPSPRGGEGDHGWAGPRLCGTAGVFSTSPPEEKSAEGRVRGQKSQDSWAFIGR